MIVLKPSKRVVKDTQIDYDLLSRIISSIVYTRNAVVLSIHKSRFSFSYYQWDDKLIGINLDEGTSLRFVVRTLLHEIRHMMQIRHTKKKVEFKYTSYAQYYKSPEERDARKFERLTASVCTLYDTYKTIESRIRHYKLDSFRELTHNVGDSNNQD